MMYATLPHIPRGRGKNEREKKLTYGKKACFAALEKVEVYDHSRTEGWNNTIIVLPPPRLTAFFVADL